MTDDARQEEKRRLGLVVTSVYILFTSLPVSS